MSRTNRIERENRDDRNIHSAQKTAPGAPVRCAGILLGLFAALIAAFSLTGTLRAQAETGSSKTKVITTTTDESFAIESAKLAKKKRGLTVKSTGEVRPYSSARLIVGMKSGKKVDFSKYGAATVVESSFGVSIVQFSSGSAAKKAASSLKKLSSVRYVDADDCTLNLGDTEIKKIYYDESSYEKDMGTSSLSKNASDAETYDKSQLNNLDYTYDTTVKQNAVAASSSSMSWGVSVIEADKYAAYVKKSTSRSVKVAIVDSGVSYHPRMEGRILSGIDLIDNDTNASDENGHGTHVAGTVVDCTPGIKVYILPVRVMNASGAGSPSVVGNGVRYAVSKGAKVINLSLGGYSHYQYLEDCINYAHNNGVTVVIASGNENENTKYVCPAHMTNPVIVGSINRDKTRSSFSNYGDSLDLVAPGDNIVSCWMGGGYAVASGTSMAAPHISGVAAMYRIMYPTYGSSKTKIMLRTFVQDLGPEGTDIYYGRGTPKLTGPIKPLKVTLNKNTAKVEIKKTLTLKATLTPSYAGQKKLTWTSSNTAVATVSSSGKVTAKKKGTATITAEGVGGRKASCKVTVIGIQPIGLKLNLSSKKLEVGSSVTLKGTVSPSNAENKSLTWSTNNKAVAVVSSTGKVTAKKKGTATITAKTVNGKKAACKVTVIGIQPTGVKLNLNSKKLEVGSSVTLKGTVSPSNAEKKTLTWSSSNTAIAAVSTSGKVTVKKKGTATITAKTVNGKKAACKVTVIGIQPTGVKLDLNSKKLEVGSSVTLKGTVSPSNAENKTLTWASSDTAVASVSSSGKVTAIKDGTALITVITANGKKADCRVDVVPRSTFTTDEVSLPETPDEEESVSVNPSASGQETAEEDTSAFEVQSTAEEDASDIPLRNAEEESLFTAVMQPAKATDDFVGSTTGPQEDKAPFLSLDKKTYTVTCSEQYVELLADICLPGATDAATNGQTDQPLDGDENNPSASMQIQDTCYVLAMLREEQDGARTLLGTVDLNPDPDKDRTVSGTGILLQSGYEKNGDIWEISLLADLSPWMTQTDSQQQAPDPQDPQEAYSKGYSEDFSKEFSEVYYSGIFEGYSTSVPTDGIITWNCILAVYDRHNLEEREYAYSIPDPDTCNLIDTGAVCSCPFILNMETGLVADEEETLPDADNWTGLDDTEGSLPDGVKESQEDLIPEELTDTEPALTEEAMEEAMEGSIERPAGETLEGSIEEPVEGSTEEPVEGPTEEPVEESPEELMEGTVEESMEGTVEEPMEGSVEIPMEETTEVHMEETAAEPMERFVEELMMEE